MNKEQKYKRIIQGKVVNKSGNKSFSILVERKVVHPKYRKIVKRFKKYIIHDEDNSCNIGDLIEAIECRPISKNKSFKLNKTITTGV